MTFSLKPLIVVHISRVYVNYIHISNVNMQVKLSTHRQTYKQIKYKYVFVPGGWILRIKNKKIKNKNYYSRSSTSFSGEEKKALFTPLPSQFICFATLFSRMAFITLLTLCLVLSLPIVPRVFLSKCAEYSCLAYHQFSFHTLTTI